MQRSIALTAAALVASLAMATAALGDAQPYRTNDPGGFRNILPPGVNGLATGPQIAAFLSACPPGGTRDCPNAPRPPHSDRELHMYNRLVYATPGLGTAEIRRYFKDASFGIRPGYVEREYSPPGRSDVTIQRDEQFGVPRVYGDNREATMYAAGYASAEDRLFFMDVLRHLGRAQLSSFAGGAQGNRDFDRDQWRLAPYTEADLQRQVDLADEVYGAEGIQVREDATNYVAGINAYIDEAKSPLDLGMKMPGEYAAIGQPEGPDEWKVTDVIATASLVGGIFGKGGGGELGSGMLLQEAKRKFGPQEGRRVWQDFRSADDPEAPTTVFSERFPYEEPPQRRAPGSLALPDRGSVENAEVVESSSGASQRAGDRPAGAASSGGILGLSPSSSFVPRANSNALLVSARESSSGHPVAVVGPQTGYFAPQILMDIELHSPPVGGPAIDGRGAAFPGISLYVELGRGRDYVWSATSAGQDNIDTFAVDLCKPGGGRPSLNSKHYMFRGDCLRMEELRRTNSWTPSAADQTPPGSETLIAQRTKLGIVTARGRIDGEAVAYTSLRSTYQHEADSARAFIDFLDPNKIRNARDYQRAAHKVDYTFNWFYADDDDIAYFNSGDNPIRGEGTDPNFPVRARRRFEWRDFDPELSTATYTPFNQHPQAINQRYLTSWNNKQAEDYRAADSNYSFGSVHRSQPLDDRIVRETQGDRKMTLPELIDAMEDAGTVDLRADKVLRWALLILGPQADPALATAIQKLEAWVRSGAHRRDRDRNGVYEHSDAIQILDAWWPRWIEAQFKPVLGEKLYEQVQGMQRLDNEPNNHGDHLGSAYQDGWYGFAAKDLRSILGRRVRGGYSREYCGRGDIGDCRRALRDSLRQALAVDRADLYGGDSICEDEPDLDDQWCFDSVWHRPLGGISQPLIHWINRPTFQQAVEIRGRAPR